METFLLYSVLIIIGLCMGSFAAASVWRLRAKQLEYDKKTGETYDKKEFARLQKLTGNSVAHDRSQCLECGYGLKWYDLIPLVSWASLGGKCRSCRKSIGLFEPIMELGVAAFFVLSYVLWPYDIMSVLEITRFGIWLAAGVGLAILFAYDSKWFLLPDAVSFAVIGLGIINVVLLAVDATDPLSVIYSTVGAVAILSGLYLALYVISKGEWIGFGDVKLGLGLALLLADWQLAFVALFSANIIGCVILIPAMAMGKIKRQTHVPFGPLLIAGCIVAQLFGNYVVATYISSII